MITRRKILARSLKATFGACLLAFALLSGPVSAQDSSPKSFIAELGDNAIRALAGTSAGDSDRHSQFRVLFLEGFDVITLSRYAIGRYWRKADKDQRREYQALFTDFIVKTYATRFGQYSGEKLSVTGERVTKGKDTIVQSQIIRPSGAPVRVDWRVRDRDGKFKVIDIVVEGVSMAITQREEFSSVIRRSGGKVDGLIVELRNKTQ